MLPFPYFGVAAVCHGELVRSLELLTGVETRLLDFKLMLRPSFSPDCSDGNTMVFCAELVIGMGFSQQCVVRSWTCMSSSETAEAVGVKFRLL